MSKYGYVDPNRPHKYKDSRVNTACYWCARKRRSDYHVGER